ncbi:MAG: hypothetical protein HRU01_27075 [Myxococcales bacterium]|nr:hypothetical protein [Myxococcales bacterium]
MIKKIWLVLISLQLQFKVEKLISKKEYEKAKEQILTFNKKNKILNKLQELSLLNKHILFLTRDYTHILEDINHVIILIEKSKVSDANEKIYLKVFIYNLLYLSYRLEDRLEEAYSIRNKVHDILVERNINYVNIKPHIEKKYPIYAGYILKNLFKDNEYNKIYSYEKLEIILDDDIFDIDGKEIEDKDSLTIFNKEKSIKKDDKEKEFVRIIRQIENNTIEINNKKIKFEVTYKIIQASTSRENILLIHKIHKSEIDFAGQIFTHNAIFKNNIPFPDFEENEFSSNDMSVFYSGFSDQNNNILEFIFQGNNIRHGYYTVETKYDLTSNKYLEHNKIKIY